MIQMHEDRLTLAGLPLSSLQAPSAALSRKPPLDTAVCVRREEAIRTGFLLSQGGEFAFVLLSLAKELKVLPDELNRLLIIVVVLSMALTPFLAELGKTVADASAAKREPDHNAGASSNGQRLEHWAAPRV